MDDRAWRSGPKDKRWYGRLSKHAVAEVIHELDRRGGGMIACPWVDAKGWVRASVGYPPVPTLFHLSEIGIGGEPDEETAQVIEVLLSTRTAQ